MAGAGRFRRWVLPAFAFKAVVIGGGYATGRELAEYFLPYGPLGGLAAIMLAAMVWSIVCAATFCFAHWAGARDYNSFFTALLGRFAVVFDLAYLLVVVLLLGVFGAAAGAIGRLSLGLPPLAGTILLTAAIGIATWRGNDAVEAVFKYVSVLLYGTYAAFFLLCLHVFGGTISHALAASPAPRPGWPLGGMTYASYNVVGAIAILPVLRHTRTPRDAVIAGALCGPLAILPAAAFFLCMLAVMPAIADAELPAAVLLAHLHAPWFDALFQAMIASALLESGCGLLNGVRQRAGARWGRNPARAATMLLLVFATCLAGRFGLVTLIAQGYRALAWVFVGIYVLPLLTVGLWRMRASITTQLRDRKELA